MLIGHFKERVNTLLNLNLNTISKNMKIIISCLLFVITNSYAKQLPEFYRGVRAMGMGGAFTAIADDKDSVFYNPAGLSYNQDVKLSLVNPKFDASYDDISIRNVSGGLTGDTVTKIFGKNYYFSGTTFPAIYLPNFVMGYYYGIDFHLSARNLSLPSLEAQYHLDKGVITGFGLENHGFSRLHYFRWGLALSWLTRSGYEGVIPITSLVTADKTYIKTLNKGPAVGWGLTPGIQYEITMNKMDSLIFGSAWQNIGDTKFGSALSSSPPPAIQNNLSAGTAFVHRFGKNLSDTNNLKLALEMRHLTQEDKDPRLKLHAGSELDLGMLKIQAGFNQTTNITFGIGVDLWLMQVSAVTYGVDNQALSMMDRERRYMLQITMDFDVLPADKKRSVRAEDRYRYPRKF